jgi:hypothetical protein
MDKREKDETPVVPFAQRYAGLWLLEGFVPYRAGESLAFINREAYAAAVAAGVRDEGTSVQ